MRVPEHVGWRKVQRQIVVVNLEQGEIAYFEGPEMLMWENIAAGSSNEDTVTRLTEVYEVTTEVARQDVDSFIASLTAHGLIERDS